VARLMSSRTKKELRGRSHAEELDEEHNDIELQCVGMGCPRYSYTSSIGRRINPKMAKHTTNGLCYPVTDGQAMFVTVDYIPSFPPSTLVIGDQQSYSETVIRFN
jgi:hypothetical protein